VDVVFKARHVDVSDSFRAVAKEKLGRMTRLEAGLDRLDVEVCGERNPRQSGRRMRVELTCRPRGHVVRAEAAAADELAALDLAVAKLEMRLRRAADRRRVHHGNRTPVSLAAATSEVPAAARIGAPSGDGNEPPSDHVDGAESRGPFVVREKEHRAVPMSLEQAVFDMEMVGHDFYLFVEASDGTPSVVYKRHGYDYGVLRLRAEDPSAR
jgi:ribosomal subunit interface protein